MSISSSSEENGRSMSPTNKIACFHATPACRMSKRKCLRESRKCQNALFSLAGIPQMPKRSFFDLREPRKRQKLLFSICGNPASAKNYFFRFAGIPQAPKTTFFHLRESRKRQKLLFFICGNPGSNKKFIFPSAGLPQAFPKIISSRLRLYLQGISGRSPRP